MNRLRKVWLPLLCVALAWVCVLADPTPLQVLRNAQFDQFQRWQPRPWVDVGVVVVDLDEESLRRLGQWPWPRKRVAALVDALRDQGAAVVGMDVLFAEPDRTSPRRASADWALPSAARQALDALPDHDAQLAQSLRAGGVVLGTVLAQGASVEAAEVPAVQPFRVVQSGEQATARLHAFDSAIGPLAPLQQAAAGVGALNFVADPDGVLRRVPLFFLLREQVVPTLVAEVLRVAQGAQNYVLKGAAQPGAGLQELRIGALAVPTTAQGELWLHYSDDVSARTLPAWQILQGAGVPQRLAGKLVLVGTSAQGLMDMRASPRGQFMPGVQAHAQALEQLLSGQGLHRPSWALGLEALVVVLGCLSVGLVATVARAAVSAACAVALVVALLLGSWWAFAEACLLLNALEPAVWVLLTFLVCSVQRHLATEREQRWIRRAFSRYVSPNRVAHLVQHPEQLELGGKRQECSFVFTDVAGFTTLMESLDPARAVGFINDYLDRMIAIAFAHGGTLDRIMGDAVAVVFSAPLPQPDHRQRAVRCALDMDAFATGFSAQLRAREGIAFGHTRIGVHTGEVIVGNFGGASLFDYRALGDAVNTASRLEGANKHLGTRVCISAASLIDCSEVPVRPVGALVLKGKTQAVEVFEPMAATAPQAAPLEPYREAFAALVRGDAGARALWQALAEAYPEDPLVQYHWRRWCAGEEGTRIAMLGK